MRIWIPIVLAAALMTSAGAEPASDPLVGDWLLITEFNGQDVKAKLIFAQTEDGSWSGRYVPSRGGAMTLSEISLEGGVLKFVRTGRGRTIQFEGTVKANRITGRHKLGGREIAAWGARGTDAIAALEKERQQANAPDPDLERDYDKRSRRAAPRDAFPVLFDPKLTPVAEAKGIDDDEPVIGIEMGGDARAYPISIMGRHELANDTCHGEPIAASW